MWMGQCENIKFLFSVALSHSLTNSLSLYIHKYKYECVVAHMCMHIYKVIRVVDVYIHVYIYIYIYIHKHIHVHVHVHAHMGYTCKYFRTCYSYKSLNEYTMK